MGCRVVVLPERLREAEAILVVTPFPWPRLGAWLSRRATRAAGTVAFHPEADEGLV